MKSNRVTVLNLALISLIILPTLCSATMTVSMEADRDNYFIGNRVTFTGSVVIVDGSGCCDLDSASLAVTGGSSKICALATDEGNYDSGYGNCSLVMNVTETHPDECNSYGGNNTITYRWIYWTIPSDWTAGDYTATITASACGDSNSDSADFRVLANTSSDNSNVDVTEQVTDETASGLVEADITLENSAGTEQNATVTIPIPDSALTVNLTLSVPESGTRYIAALENGMICSPEKATIGSVDYSSSSEELTFDLSGGGEQEIVVYVGGEGEPTSITVEDNPVTSWTYSSTAETVTFTATISCPDEVVVSWYVAPTTTTTTTRVSGSRSVGSSSGGMVSVGKVKPSCFDGIKNCHDGLCEEDVDCGGSCKACSSCKDGIQNQGETGVDCGGPCPPCKITTTTKPKATTTTVAATTLAEATTSTTSTTVVRTTLAPTTTIPPSQGIPLGVTEGAIILIAIALISIAFMIQTGRI